MNAFETHRVRVGEAPKLREVATDSTGGYSSRKDAASDVERCLERLFALQYLLHAGGDRSLLIVLQGMDAAGKDGVIRHLFKGLSPQGTRVTAFKQPTTEEASHDFLWRVHRAAPARGEVAIFNRSHYEDVVTVRVHDLVGPAIWKERYQLINDFEAQLTAAGTVILKFFLHVSPDEQLRRFEERLTNPARQWKISEADYSDRDLWRQHREAYEDVLALTNTAAAPWFIIPADHRWYRNHAVAGIVAATLERMGLKHPPARVDLDDIRRQFHSAAGKAHSIDR